MELTSICTKHQEAVGGFTILYNFEEGEDDICPFCKLQAKKKKLKKALRFYADEKNYTPSGIIGETHQDGMRDVYIEDRGRIATKALTQGE